MILRVFFFFHSLQVSLRFCKLLGQSGDLLGVLRRGGFRGGQLFVQRGDSFILGFFFLVRSFQVGLCLRQLFA